MDDYDLRRIKDSLAAHASTFCKYLFPNGTEKYGRFSIGSLVGEAGESLKIALAGDRVGTWKDFATGDGGNNLLELLRRVKGCNLVAACHETVEWLRMPHPQRGKSQSKPAVAVEKKALKRHHFGDLEIGNAKDIARLSRLLGVVPEALALAVEDGVLRFAAGGINGRLWVVVDKLKRVRQDRRLDGFPFILKDHSLAKARTIGSSACPIGLPTVKPFVALVEGSSDLLAAYALAYAEDMESLIAPVAMLGAANHIHPAAVDDFRGKRVLTFPDYDSAGINGVDRWKNQLDGIVKSFQVLDYGGLRRDDGQQIKDLRDFLRIAVDSWEMDAGIRCPLARFMGATEGNDGRRPR
jgi:hypothetical protein